MVLTFKYLTASIDDYLYNTSIALDHFWGILN